MRDIVHEQVSQSTDQQLADRLAVLIARSGGRGYDMAHLQEFHAIRSEQFCRGHGIKSEPWVTWMRRTKAQHRRG